MGMIKRIFKRHRGKENKAVAGQAAVTQPARPKFRYIMPLEQRFMLDAAGAPTAAVIDQHHTDTHIDMHAGDKSALSEQSEGYKPAVAPDFKDFKALLTHDRAATASQTKEVVFVDPRVQDYQALVAGVKQGVDIVVLDPSKDGITQISSYLSTHKGITALQIFSHGTPGTVLIGSTQLDSNTLDTRSVDISSWSGSLTENADIMIYGCDVAEGSKGMAFIGKLAQTTGADVAASTDLTGAASKGGDWVLEKSTGAIEAILPLTGEAIAGYDALMAVPVVTNPGTLSVAEDTLSNAFGGGLTVTSDSFATMEAVVQVTSGNGVVIDGDQSGSQLASQGDRAGINNFLSGLKFQGNQDWNGTATITVTVYNDYHTHADPATITFNIDVSAVNDAPTAANNTLTVNEDTNLALTAGNFNFSDVDAGNTLQSIKITTLPTAGTLKLNGTNVTLNQVISRADIEAGNLVFKGTQDAKGAPYGTFGFKVNDGTAESASAYTMTLNVTPVNDAPVTGNINLSTNKDTVKTFSLTSTDIDTGTGANDAIVTQYQIVSGPGSGTLRDSEGNIRTTGATITAAQATNMTFTPASGATGAVSFTFKAVDSATAPSNTSTVTIDVTAVNFPPVVTVPGAKSTNEDTSLTLAGAQISISDPDAGGAVVQATISAANGSVTLSQLTGLTVSGGANGSATITVQGTISNINSALTNLVYSPDANYAGADTITVQANDLGNTGGGSQTDTETITVTVNALADTPVTGAATLAGVNEDTLSPSGATVTSLLTGFSDGDGNTLAGIAISADASTAQQGHWQYSLNSGGSWQDLGAVNAGAALLLDAGAKLRFVPSANWYGTPGSLTIHAIDNSGSRTFTTSGSPQTTNVGSGATDIHAGGAALNTSITSINDAFLVETDKYLKVDEGGTTVLNGDVLKITDVEAGASNIVYTVLAAGTDLSEGQLQFDSDADGSFETIVTTGTIFTQADIDAGRLRYVHNGNEPATAQALAYSVTDTVAGGGGTTVDRSFTIKVSPKNDTPVLYLPGQTYPTGHALTATVVEGGSLTFNSTGAKDQIQVVDPDNTDEQLVFRITDMPDHGELTFNGAAVAVNSVFSYDDLGLLVYTHDGTNTTSDSFNVVLRDGAGSVLAERTVNITITDVNAAPTISGSVTIYEDQSDVSITINTSDDSTAAADRTIRILTLPTAGEAVLKFNGSVITQEQVNAGFTFAGNQLNLLTISHTSANELNPPNLSFNVRVTDGGGLSTDATIPVTVVPVNDDPVLVNNNTLALTDQNQTVQVANTVLSTTDADSDVITYRLEVRPTNGWLLLNGERLGVGATFTQADINSGILQYQHFFSGTTDSFTVTVRDGGYNVLLGRAGGVYEGADIKQVVVPITIAASGSAPGGSGNTGDSGGGNGGSGSGTGGGGTGGPGSIVVATDDVLITNEDTALVVGQSVLLGNDGGNAPINITSVANPVNGTVAINAGIVTFTPTAGFVGTGSFTYTMTDEDGATDPATVTVYVLAVNDSATPSVNQPLVLDEGTLATITNANLNAADPDNSAGQRTFTLKSLPTNGILYYDSTPGDGIENARRLWTGSSFTQADIDAGKIKFKHDGSEDFISSFDFALTDGSDNGVVSTFNINVTPVNDQPGINAGSVKVLEGGSAVLNGTIITSSDVDGVVSDKTGTGYAAVNSLTFSIANAGQLPTHGTLQLDSDGNGSFETNVVAGVTTFTQAQIDAGRLRYVHDGTETTTDSLVLTVNDNSGAGNATNTATVNIKIVPMNDDPTVVVNTGFTVANGKSLIEGQQRTITQADLLGDDTDNTDTQIQFRITADVQYGQLLRDGKILGVGSAFTNQDLIDGRISYLHDGLEGFSDSFHFYLSDGGGGSEPDQTFNIEIVPVNDQPVITVPGVHTAVEDQTLSITGISIADPDSLSHAGVVNNNFTPMMVTLSVDHGTVSFTNTAGLTFVNGTANGQATVAVTGTLGAINTALGTLTYHGTSNYVGSDTLTIRTDDLGSYGDADGDKALEPGSAAAPGQDNLFDTKTVAITVTPINDAPTLAGLTAKGYTEDGSATVIGTGVTIGDPELTLFTGSTGNWGGATLTISRNGGANAEDVFTNSSVLGALTQGGNLVYNGSTIGTVTTNSGGTLKLTFADNVTTTDAQTAIRLIAYSNTRNTLAAAQNADVTLNWVLDDGDTDPDRANNGQGAGGHLSATQSQTITLTGINDAPTLSGSTGMTTNEDTTSAGAALSTKVTVTDVDGGSSLGGLAIIGNTANAGTEGTWYYSSDAGVNWKAIGVVGDGATALALSASTQIRFVPFGNYNGTPPGLTVRALDNTYGGGYSSSIGADVTVDTTTTGNATAISSSTRTIGMTVTPVNDAPTITGDKTVGSGVTEGSAIVISNAGTSFITVGDPVEIGRTEGGADVGKVSVTVTVTNGLTHGLVTLGGTTNVTITGGANGSNTVTIKGLLADVNTALDGLSFTPGNDAGVSETVTVTVNDLGNSGTATTPGVALTATQTITISNITQVNDAPTATGSTLATANEDAGDVSPIPNYPGPVANPEPAGATVSSLFGTHFSDVDVNSSNHTLTGIAITNNAATAGQGKWQYSTDGGTVWTDVPTAGLSDAAALVLDSTDKLRFLPSADEYNGTVGDLTVRLSDGTAFDDSTNNADLKALATGAADGWSNAVALTTSISKMNDKPIISNLNDDNVTFTEAIGVNVAGTAVLLDNPAALATLSDIELTVRTETTFNGATLTVRDDDGADTRDFYVVQTGSGISVSGTYTEPGSGLKLFSNGSSVRYNGTTIGTITDNSSASGILVITFNANASGAALNALLQNLAFSSDNDSIANITKDINVTFNDGNTGAQGTGGALSDTAIVHIALTPSNDAPSFTSGATISTNEDVNTTTCTLASLLDPKFSDPDSAGALAGVALSAYDEAGKGTWMVNVGGWCALSTLMGGINSSNALLLNANTEIQFVVNANANTAGSSTPSLTVFAVESAIPAGADDSAGHAPPITLTTVPGDLKTYNTTTDTLESRVSSGSVTINVQIAAKNDAPTFGGTAFNDTLVESSTPGIGTGLQQLVTGSNIADLDLGTTATLNSNTFGAGSITVALTGGTTGDTLTLSGSPAGVSGTSGGANGANFVINLTTSATVAQVNTIIEAIRFQHTTDNPPAGARAFTVTLNDGNNTDAQSDTAGGPNPLTAQIAGSITITSANDAPVLADTVLTMTAEVEDCGAPAGAVGTLISGLTGGITDADTGASKGIAITTADTANGTWLYSTDGGANWNAFPAVTADNALRLFSDANTRIYFQPNANYEGTLATAITFRAWDRTDAGANGSTASVTSNGPGTAFSSATDTASLVVSAVNDTPSVANLNATPTFTEGTDSAGDRTVVGTAVVLDNSVNIGDVELVTRLEDNFNGAILTIARDNGSGGFSANAQDILAIQNQGTGAGQVGITGTTSGNVTYGGTTIGTYSYSSGTLTITFNASANFTSVDAVASAITYANNSDTPPANVVLRYRINDNNVDSAQGTGGSLTGDATITVAITAQNDMPLAVDDVNTIAEDAVTATGNVITTAPGQDSDPEPADTLTVTTIRTGTEGAGGGTTAVNAGTTSANGTAIAGSYGTLTLGADGSYSYALDNTNPLVNQLKNGVNLTEYYTYAISDGNGGSDTAQLTITITGHTDGAPTISPVDGNAGAAGQATVNEAGLTTVPDTTETTTGTVTINALDGLTKVTVGGTDVTTAQLAALVGTPVVINTGEGTLTLTGFNATATVDGTVPTAGTLSYTYTLNARLDHTGGTATASTDDIALVVTDRGNAMANGTLTVQIVDDVPTANADANSVTEDGAATVTGNVVTTGPGADRIGADIPANPVTAISFGGAKAVGVAFNTTYGSLTLNADGSYSYTLDNTKPAVNQLRTGETLTETVSYTITDADGDTSTANLVITINGNTDGAAVIAPVDGNAAAAGHATVLEAGLTTVPDASETTTGTVTVNTLDGLTKITVGGTDVTEAALHSLGASNVTINTPKGVLVLTDFTDTTSVGGILTTGTLHYTYTLSAAQDQPGASESADNIALVVTAASADTANSTLTIRIVDDVPTANADANSVTEDGAATITGNVFGVGGASAGDHTDRIGADIPANPVTAINFGGAKAVGVAFNTTYGSLTLNANGSYSYTLDNANTAVNQLKNGEALTETVAYTITDSDGDLSTTNLVIAINGANDAPSATVDLAPAVEKGGVNNATAGSNGTGNVLTNDNDVDSGDTKTVTAVSFGLTNGVVGNDLAGTYGTLRLNSDGSYTYTVNDGDATVQALRTNADTLTEVFNYTMRDTAGATSTATLTVTMHGANDNPVAANDSANADEKGGTANGSGGANATGNVLTNDTDVDAGDGKTVSAIRTGAEGESGTGGTVGSALTGAHGTLTLNSDGTYTYAVNENDAAVQALRLNTDTITDTFTYTVKDTGNLTDTAELTITIRGANDAPVAAVDTPNAIEAGGVNNATAGLNPAGNVLTNDADADAGDTKTVTAVSFGATDGTVGQDLAGTYGTLKLNSDGTYTYTIDNNNATVEALRTNGETLTEVFAYTMRDTAGATSSTTLTVSIHGANDNPVAVADIATAVEAGGIANATAGSNATGNVLTNDTDIDAADTKTVSAVTGMAAGTVGGDTTGAYGHLELNPDGTYTYTVDNSNAAVQALRTGADILTDTFIYTVRDTAGDTSSTTLTVTIHGKNDTPVFVPADAIYTENAAPVVLSGGLLVTDGDDTHMSGATVKINSPVAGDTLTAVTTGTGITAVYDAGSGILTFSGTDTKEHYQQVLQSVTFSSTSDDPTVNATRTTRNVTWSVTDNNSEHAETATADTVLTVVPQTDNPVVTAGGTRSYTEMAGPIVVESGLTLTDVDDTHMSGASVSIGNFVAGDMLTAVTDGTGISASYDVATGVLTLTGTDTKEHYQQVFRTVTYSSTSVDPTLNNLQTSRTITWKVTDANSDLNTPVGTGSDTTTINIGPLDDAPVNIVPGDQDTDEDTPLVFSPDNDNAIKLTDVDAGDSPVQLTLTATGGTLNLSGLSGITVTGGGDGTDTITVIGKLSDLNAALNGLKFTPSADYNGPASLTVTVNDKGNTGAGGPLEDSDTIAINIRPVVDIAGNEAVTDEDTPVTISVLDNDTFSGDITITEVTQGTYGTVTVNPDKTITYTPDPDYNGPDSYTYTVTSGGVTETVTVKITVRPVVDIADDSAVTNESTPVIVKVLVNDTFEGTPIVTGVTQGGHGRVTINPDNTTTYRPDDGFSGIDTYTYTVTSGEVTETATVRVTVNPVIMPPLMDDTPQIIVPTTIVTAPADTNPPATTTNTTVTDTTPNSDGRTTTTDSTSTSSTTLTFTDTTSQTGQTTTTGDRTLTSTSTVIFTSANSSSNALVSFGGDSPGSASVPNLYVVLTPPAQEISTLKDESFSIPTGLFKHSDTNAKVVVTASLSSGNPLPGWIKFEPASGKFTANPPEGSEGVLDIKISARDDKGKEAATNFKLQIIRSTEREGAGKKDQKQPQDPRGDEQTDDLKQDDLKDGQQDGRDTEKPDKQAKMKSGLHERTANRLIKGRPSLSEQMSSLGRGTVETERLGLIKTLQKAVKAGRRVA